MFLDVREGDCALVKVDARALMEEVERQEAGLAVPVRKKSLDPGYSDSLRAIKRVCGRGFVAFLDVRKGDGALIGVDARTRMEEGEGQEVRRAVPVKGRDSLESVCSTCALKSVVYFAILQSNGSNNQTNEQEENKVHSRLGDLLIIENS